MEFILPFPLKPAAEQISIRDKVILMGSCFTEEIGLRMKERRFSALINGHGILYNPLSIARSLREYMEKKRYDETHVFHANGLWQSFHHHSRFSHTELGTCLNNINCGIEAAHDQLKKSHWLIVTLGSAFVYRYKDSGQWVGNCHKLPNTAFEKVLLEHDVIIEEWTKLLSELQAFNPGLRVLFTVSPVRYVRDGLVENNRSKGILLNAVHSLVAVNRQCSYFPSFEIVIDELRDYRFFKEDLVHPNELAIRYVWEKFVDAQCDKDTQQFLKEYEPLLKGTQHRAFQEESEAHQRFRKDLQTKIESLEKKYLS